LQCNYAFLFSLAPIPSPGSGKNEGKEKLTIRFGQGHVAGVVAMQMPDDLTNINLCGWLMAEISITTINPRSPSTP
jgi:hypothetical protein